MGHAAAHGPEKARGASHTGRVRAHLRRDFPLLPGVRRKGGHCPRQRVLLGGRGGRARRSAQGQEHAPHQLVRRDRQDTKGAQDGIRQREEEVPLEDGDHRGRKEDRGLPAVRVP